MFRLSCLQRSILGLFVVQPARTMQVPVPGARFRTPCGSSRSEHGSSNERRHPSVKFRVERDVLAEAVTWTARSLSPRPPVPVLSGPAAQGRSRHRQPLELRLRDVRQAGNPCRHQHRRHHPGSGRLLADICRSLPSAPVEVETDGNKVTLTCRRQQLPPGHHAGSRIPAAAGTARHQRHRRRATPSPRPFPR